MTTPRTHATAYRLWCHCEAIGWDTTLSDAARELGVTMGHIRRVVQIKGWASRFRATVGHIGVNLESLDDAERDVQSHLSAGFGGGA